MRTSKHSLVIGLAAFASIALTCSLLSSSTHAQIVEGGFRATVYNTTARYEAVRLQAVLNDARRTCNRASFDQAMRQLEGLVDRAQVRAQQAEQAATKACEFLPPDYIPSFQDIIDHFSGKEPDVRIQSKACEPARLASSRANTDASSLRSVLIYERARGFDCVRSTPPSVSEGRPPVLQGRGFSVFVEGGANIGAPTFHLDPGAFVPVNERIGSTQGFFGGGIEVFAGNFLPQIDTIVGFRARTHFGDGAQRSFNLGGALSGDVKQAADWSVTGYLGVPFVLQQTTPFLPILIVTPNAGITYQQDTLRSAQTLGGVTNIFETSFGRVGGTLGVNLDIPAGTFTYGLTTGVTLLPQTDVRGTSSLGLPARAQVQSLADLFIGVRAGWRTQVERVGNELFF